MSENRLTLYIDPDLGSIFACDCGNFLVVDQENKGQVESSIGRWPSASGRKLEGFCKRCSSEVRDVRGPVRDRYLPAHLD